MEHLDGMDGTTDNVWPHEDIAQSVSVFLRELEATMDSKLDPNYDKSREHSGPVPGQHTPDPHHAARAPPQHAGVVHRDPRGPDQLYHVPRLQPLDLEHGDAEYHLPGLEKAGRGADERTFLLPLQSPANIVSSSCGRMPRDTPASQPIGEAVLPMQQHVGVGQQGRAAAPSPQGAWVPRFLTLPPVSHDSPVDQFLLPLAAASARPPPAQPQAAVPMTPWLHPPRLCTLLNSNGMDMHTVSTRPSILDTNACALPTTQIPRPAATPVYQLQLPEPQAAKKRKLGQNFLQRALWATQSRHLSRPEYSHIHPPPEQAMEEMLRIWGQSAGEVDELSSRRDSKVEISRQGRCQGCGNRKLGHKRGGMHGKCPRVMCHCGIHRCLHPAPLSPGARCNGEWLAIVQRYTMQISRASSKAPE